MPSTHALFPAAPPASCRVTVSVLAATAELVPRAMPASFEPCAVTERVDLTLMARSSLESACASQRCPQWRSWRCLRPTVGLAVLAGPQQQRGLSTPPQQQQRRQGTTGLVAVAGLRQRGAVMLLRRQQHRRGTMALVRAVGLRRRWWLCSLALKRQQPHRQGTMARVVAAGLKP